MAGLNVGDKFDFVIACADAYGDYDERGVMKLDKKMFFNGDGEFDKEHVFVGNIIPMRTVDGQIVNAQVAEVSEKEVTIDLNHPYAGEDLHFVGEVIDLRDADPKELKDVNLSYECCSRSRWTPVRKLNRTLSTMALRLQRAFRTTVTCWPVQSRTSCRVTGP